MRAHFRDRTEAGALLAQKLLAYANRGDVLVLALPRGGVPVACAVAQRLHAPMDVLVVRKLGVPGHEEYAMGAIATGGIRILHMPVISALQIPPEAIEAATAREQVELERREKAYRAGRPPPIVRGMTVILVDDGIATGSTVRAAARALRQMEARFIVIAAPTAAPTAVRDLRRGRVCRRHHTGELLRRGPVVRGFCADHRRGGAGSACVRRPESAGRRAPMRASGPGADIRCPGGSVRRCARSPAG